MRGLVEIIGFPAIFSHCAHDNFRRVFFAPVPFTGCFKAMVSTGSFRKRLPVAAKIALLTAGTIAEVPALAHPVRRVETLNDVDLEL